MVASDYLVIERDEILMVKNKIVYVIAFQVVKELQNFS
jgi:hypothetical protein